MHKLKNLVLFLTIVGMVIFMPFPALADDASVVDTGDTTLIIICGALVFFMTPALGLFYAGMVSKKNALNTIMSSLVLIGIITVEWVAFGYSAAFGEDFFGIIGKPEFIGLAGVGTTPNADYAPTIPHILFAVFNMMFAIITPAIASGAIVERARFGPYVIFVLLWGILVYNPMCHMVWGVGGFLRGLGALDFAGGTVVHITSGISSLVACLVLGRRKNYGIRPTIPHNLPTALLGGAIIWLGWYGFNTGCALASGELAGLVFSNTAIASGASLLSWIIIEWLHRGKPTLLGSITGAICGLVAITPAVGFVPPISAVLIGLLVGPVCYFAIVYVKKKLGYDDSLDPFGCHGVGGMFGAIMTGLLATTAVNSAGGNGLFYGNPKQVLIQLFAIVFTIVWAGLATFLILKVISLFTKLRVSEQEEDEGLDLAMHGEEAYSEL